MSTTKNPKDLLASSDIVSLIYSEEDDVMVNLRERFKKKYVYTAISHIMLAVNPYARHKIYGQDAIDAAYLSVREGTTSEKPHVYQVSARAYQWLSAYGKNQSVIVSGESGSGKTENAKRLMECLTAASSANAHLEDQILRCNPILESFGNAKTLMNNNSSRFAKFTKIIFAAGQKEKLVVAGARIKTYLLEKSRITLQSAQERNFHIFYLCFEAQKNAQSGLNMNLSTKMSDYRYLCGVTTVDGRNDFEEYEELERGWKALEFSKDDVDAIYQSVAGVLHLGQVEFKENDKGFAEITSKTMGAVEDAARLLGLDKSALIERLQTRSIKVGMNVIMANLNVKDANSNRDALAKIMFHQMFEYLVHTLSEKLSKGQSNANDDEKFIGILDVFGFESFEYNSLDQFCINFCNEVLQQFFNESVIISEQEEYIKEGLPWNEMTVASNEEMVKMVSDPKKGIFALLDSSCQMPKPTADQWHADMVKKWGKKSKLFKINKKKSKSAKKYNEKTFLIVHYAQEVEYFVGAFLPKNRDTVHQDTVKLLNNSNKSVIVSSMKLKKQSKKSKTFSGVGTSFCKQLNRLSADLKKTKPWFLRCLNPNKVKSDTKWSREHMQKQLRCNGIIEAIKVIKLGYPSRCDHQFVLKKFSASLLSKMPSFKSMNTAKKTQCILWGLGINSNEYELGFTKIFFKPSDKTHLSDMQAHNGKFSDDQIKQIMKKKTLSYAVSVVGLIRCYFRLAKPILAKLAMTEAIKFVKQACILSKLLAAKASPSEPMVMKESAVKESAVSDDGSYQSDEGSYKSDEGSYVSSSSGYNEISDKEQKPIAANKANKNKNGQSAMQRKIDMLAKAWSLNAVLGETFLKHGRSGYPHERVVQVDLPGKQLLWGSGMMDLRMVIAVRSGLTTDVFKKNKQNLDANLCFSVVLKDRTLDLVATRKGQRNVWVAALRLISGQSKASKLFQKLRGEILNNDLKEAL